MIMQVLGIYDPGDDLTGFASADVLGGRFVSVSGDRDATSGTVKFATTAAGARAHGVARFDAKSGNLFTVARGNARVVEVQAGAAAITAGHDVEVGANGVAVTQSTGVAVGYVVTGCAANGVAQVSLY
jgi:hypothetical protein